MGSLPLDARGLEGLSTREWYLVLSNHRSWVDILVLQAVFNRRIPFLKFFLKQQLIWVPFLGLAWWALDFPFMRRYTAAYLEKHPEHRGKDLEVTRRACEKFRADSHLGDEFRRGHALHAREARGVQVAVPQPAADARGRHLVRALVDGRHAAFAAGRDDRVLDRDAEPLGPVLRPRRHRGRGRAASPDRRVDVGWRLRQRPGFRERFKAWLAGIWADKDELLDRLLQ